MKRIKQSFILCFALVFMVTSITLTYSGLHHIKTLNHSEEATIENSIKKIEIKEVKDNIKVEIYTELPSSEKFTDEEATIEYPLDIYETIYLDANNNIVSEENRTPETEYKTQLIANKLGTYEVKVIIGEEEKISHIIIEDTKAPELKLKEITINENDAYNVGSFIESCSDNSKKECRLAFKDEKMASYKTNGTYEIMIIASDESNNKSEGVTKLIVNKPGSALGTQPTTPTTPTTPSTPTTPTTPTTPSNPTPDPTPTPDQTPTPDPPKPTVYVPSSSEINSVVSSGSAYYDELLTITNQYRAEVGAPALTLDPYLNRVATLRAIEMAKNSCNGETDCFSHTRPDGSDWSTAFNYIGSNNFRMIGENLAYGQRSPSQAMSEWKASATHYNNIINTGFTKIGYGAFNYNGHWYWVQSFGG